MEKTNEQLLADYKKSNKQRRERIVKAAGFTAEVDYLNSLKSVSKATKTAPKKPAKIKIEKDKLDYIVAFDTTGSMNSYIGDVKNHVETLIPQMFSQDIDLKMKIIAFGDYCDINRWGSNPPDGFGVAYQQSSFTDNQSELISFVKNAKGTGGGDEDEFYELVIKKIVEETPWRNGARKAVLFIADCNPHPVGYRYNNTSYHIDWRKEAQKAADLKIAFDTLAIHGQKYPWYKELAKITGGVYLPFQSSNKMAEVVTASAYSRGSKMSKETFVASYAAASASGDEELVGVYKSLSTLLD